MDAQQREIKRNALLLEHAIKTDNLGEIDRILSQSSYPIDALVTDTGMSGFQFACGWS